MKYTVTRNSISAEGSEEEIKKFGECLTKIVGESTFERFKNLKYGVEPVQFELDRNHIVDVSKTMISYTPDKIFDEQKETHLRAVKNLYIKARHLYDNQ